MDKRTRMAVALAAGALWCGLAPTEAAKACGGAMMEEAEYIQMDIAKRVKLRDAQDAIERGDLEVAAVALRTAVPYPGGSLVRARRLLAKLIVRSEGRYDAFAHERGKTDENLKTAVRIISLLPRSDPRALTDLGEALSKRSETLATAREVLADLAQRDLITSAEGWAALARLSSPKGADAAMERCRQMALDPERSCGLVSGTS